MGDADELKFYLNNPNLLQDIKSRRDLPKEDAVLNRLKQPLDCLVVCKIDDEVGHGLFATQRISAGTVLFLYSGTIEPAKIFSEGDSYTYAWGSIDSNNVKHAVSAKNSGGLARFMQHLPQDPERHKRYLKQGLQQQFGAQIQQQGVDLDVFVNEIMGEGFDDELENIKFKDINGKAQLATSNVRPCQTVIHNIPVIVCVAQYDIEENEQLGFSYGQTYWQAANRRPRYFFKNGNLIPTEAYSLKKDLIQNSVKALITNQQAANPMTLYQNAIYNYKNKNIEAAISQLEQALTLFKAKKGEASMESGNCYSTLTSCYRDSGEIDQAIDCCEQAIIIYHGNKKNDLTNIAKKYKDCLTQSNAKPNVLYTKAIEHYKAKQYILATYVLQVALENFKEKGTKEQQAICHSTLASCYRELREYSKAIEHANQALELCEQFLGEENKLTSNTRKKLESIKVLAGYDTYQTKKI